MVKPSRQPNIFSFCISKNDLKSTIKFVYQTISKKSALKILFAASCFRILLSSLLMDSFLRGEKYKEAVYKAFKVVLSSFLDVWPNGAIMLFTQTGKCMVRAIIVFKVVLSSFLGQKDDGWQPTSGKCGIQSSIK